MEDYMLGIVEAHFADLIWENEPIRSGELVRLAEEKLEWKKSTTYTVLRKLCDKGIFRNQESLVTSLVSRNQYYGRQGRRLVEEKFEGSLPGFLAAFTEGERLSTEDVAALKKLIEENAE
ncbi:MAG: BlaI/MecI/CopY family transcriptional regulator [Lachnospiraceae bacterium]|nr:BlaI/MecI/CopY family transcriptional regulator [Lachnospiraceae bacterium]